MATSSRLTTIKRTIKEILDLGSKSPILADSKSKMFCQQYQQLEKLDAPEGRAQLLRDICKDHGLANERLFKTINSLASNNKSLADFEHNFNSSSFEKLNNYIKPEYYDLFKNLGRVKHGVRTLVKVRQDLLETLEQKKSKSLSPEDSKNIEELKIMNSVLKNILTLWFSTGLLNIQRIEWKSPAILVEKVAHYESVHQIRTLNDLKSRLSSNRRCFIYTHSTMPYEPLVILHIALTNSITSSIQDLIPRIKTPVKDFDSEDTNKEEEKNCTNAIFYSINSCQKGLQQVDLGNALIKSCVRLLKDELPNLKYFHTLSPIPNFKKWFDLKLDMNVTNLKNPNSKSSEFFDIKKFFSQEQLTFLMEYFQVQNDLSSLVEKIKAYINSDKFRNSLEILKQQDFSSDSVSDTDIDANVNYLIGRFLKRSCAFYLYYEKKNGYAFNSVCNFHIKNGAQIYRVNFGADLTDNGWRSSYGLMVNYGYYLEDLDLNCISYLIDKKIKISSHVEQLLF